MVSGFGDFSLLLNPFAFGTQNDIVNMKPKQQIKLTEYEAEAADQVNWRNTLPGECLLHH